MSIHNEGTVSVVIPVYNGARYLAEAVQSVFDQTDPPLEIIVVDDGSTDGSADIIQQLSVSSPVPIRYIYQENQGPAAARNRGIALAVGELIAFLDQDDLWLPAKLSRQIDLLRQMPRAGYALTLVDPFLQAGVPRPAWLQAGALDNPLPGYMPSCLLVRQATLRQIGLFDSVLWGAYDIDWFMRANTAGIAVALAPEALVRYRIHETNQSRDVSVLHQYILQAIRQNVLRRRASAHPVTEAGQSHP
jgi:glycosyltransferase involved in cell wall biosynthesis